MKTYHPTHEIFLSLLTGVLGLLLLEKTKRNAGPEHLIWADDIASNVAPDKNKYGADPCYIHWPNHDGHVAHENRTDCASFITRVLMQSYGWTGAYFKIWMSSSNPTAGDYHDTIARQRGFAVVDNINGMLPGDLIAIKYPAGASAAGHIMMVKTPASPRPATSPLIDGTAQYETRIIDSAQTGHGPNDTRLTESGAYTPGAGIGVLRLYAGISGAIAGYAWSTCDEDRYYDQANHSLIVGRLV